MNFKPLDRMWERVNIARTDSDATLFNELLLLGEMVTKLAAAGFVAAIADDPDRHRYRQIHRLVRANGLGDWSQVIDDVLSGTAAHLLLAEARSEQRELSQSVGPGSWQYDAIWPLHNCLKAIVPDTEDLPTRVRGRRWFSTFVALRNKTRGHGAIRSGYYSKLCPDLEDSIQKLAVNFGLFRRPWAYLQRHLSGKYRVTNLTEDGSSFDHLKSDSSLSLEDGVYLYLDRPVRVELVLSDVDAFDFYFPNGQFTNRGFETISYISGISASGSSEPYLAPALPLPPSETQGADELDVQGVSFGNLPPTQKGYIHRQTLERQLHGIVTDDRHPVVTLVGRGGIGKTSLALSVLHRLASEERFYAILWFSARDIDLRPEGPKLVKPHVLSERDIAKEFVNLVAPSESKNKGFDPLQYFSEALTHSPLDRPLLFVFDNFETVQNPGDLYAWIDHRIRTPNKVLITTRFRDFKGDYPVEVFGMTEQECEELVNATSDGLGIRHLLTKGYRRELYQESEGHPYVVKILLGEIAKAQKLVNVERIVASKDEILDALFERTFSGLSPVARRVFLTLSNWRSSIPQLALEAVLLRPKNDRMDVEGAIEELRKSSFIEVALSDKDEMPFVTVPLSASLFGRRKLAVSAMRSAVETDTLLLRDFGAAQQFDISKGVGPRIDRMFEQVTTRIKGGDDRLEDHLPVLQFIARKYPRAWLLLASFYEALGTPADLDLAKDAVRHYLEFETLGVDQIEAWKHLVRLCEHTSDYSGEVNALVAMAQLPSVSFRDVSTASKRLNSLFYGHHVVLDTSEKQIVVRRLIDVMEDRIIGEGDATDYSRLAWLYMHLRDEAHAKVTTLRGLRSNPNNYHCRNLARRLSLDLPRLR